MNLTVAIMTYNEEKNIERTLESIKNISDEIVIVDSGSTDETISIAKKFNAKIVNQKWLGYGKQRNVAIQNSTKEWILNIDADEEISVELAQKIKGIIGNENSHNIVYDINRQSVCFGKKLKYGGWGSSYAIRLFEKKSGNWDDNVVHEKFITDNKIIKLDSSLKIFHHSYLTLEDYFSRFNRYTTEAAQDYYRKGKTSNIFQIVFNPMYKFLRMYIMRLGFLDGVEGFLIAVTSSLYSMVKYFKLREIYKNGSYKSKTLN